MSADPRKLRSEEHLGPQGGTSVAALLARALSQPKPLPLADLFRACRALDEKSPHRETRALREVALADNPPSGLEGEGRAWWALHRLGFPEATRMLALESAVARSHDRSLQKLAVRASAGKRPRRIWVPLVAAPLVVLAVLAVMTEPRLAFIPLLLLWILPWWKRPVTGKKGGGS